MIPQSELDRIEREAKLYGYVFDGQRAYDNIDRIEGYEEGASSEYLRSASRMEWISVKDRLPELSGEYLACGVKGIVSTLDFDIVTQKWHSDVVPDHLVRQSMVTHWMHLPESPKQ